VADRTVTVALNARVSGYIAQMQAAGRATAAVGAEGGKVAQQTGLISPKLLGIGTAAAFVAATAVTKMANFEQAMSGVKAATGETADGMARLTEAAKEAGGATKFSAEEAADGITNLAKAGVSTTDVLTGGLDGALSLAAAGSMEVADAAEVAAAALTTFKLNGEDMTHVADLLAAGAGKAMGEVSDLGMGLKQVGTVAESTGLSVEQTVATLSALASRGILGSDAGTSLKTFLSSLVPMSDKAAKAMEEIGLQAYDAQGNFVGLEAVAGQLRSGLSRLSDEQKNEALQTIFGSDAKRAAIVLMQEGEQGVRDWTAAVNDSGYAAEYAATLTDNLNGDVEKLTGALDTLFIESADGANGPLRDLVQGLTGVIDAVGGVDAALKESDGAWGGGLFESMPANVARMWDFIKAGPGGKTNQPAPPPRFSEGIQPPDIEALSAASRELNSDLLAQAAAADEAAAAMDDLNKSYLESIDVALRLSDAQIGYEAAIDDTTATIKENGKTLDIDTEKGRANMSALNDLKGASAGLIGQMIEQGDSQEDVAKKADEMADAIYDAARQAGMGKDEAKKYADALREVPDEVKTKYEAKGADAARTAAGKVADAINAIPDTKTVLLKWRTSYAGGWEQYAKEHGIPTKHRGGYIAGTGDVPITAQAGEFVINRSQYAANADLVRAINNGSGAVSASGGMRIDVGGITVNESRTAHQNVIDALAESAYRQGMVR
jgi:TP901 family phage tail tape measure protein